MSGADELWTNCLGLLKAQVSEAVWASTFAELELIDGSSDALVIATTNQLTLERLDGRFSGMVRDVLNDAGGPGVQIRFVVRDRPIIPEPDESPRPEHHSERRIEPPREEEWSKPRIGMATRRAERDTALNAAYTFDNFVIGENNRFPHAAARAVAESPGRNYNPLFIHGGAGLGKTHLLHAIGNFVVEALPAARVKYVTTEAFLNEYIEMIRTSTGSAFRERYREVNLLLIDDVQFLESKEGLQEEFFWTFNHLYQNNSQIVLTCDTDPKSIPTLEDRLRTRLLQGLVADVQPPNLETRLAILRKRAERESFHVPEEVMSLIAGAVKDNIRELEGALTRVIAYASLSRTPLTLEIAETILADVIARGEPRRITPLVIMEATSKMFGFTIDELRSPERGRPLTNARHISMYCFRYLTELSYPSIAKEFGGRDHTTVMHAVKKIEEKMKERQTTYDQVTELLTSIRGAQ